MSVDWVQDLVQWGLVREREGDLRSAADAFKEVLRLDPGHALARERLDALRATGDAALELPGATVNGRVNPFARSDPLDRVRLTPSPFSSFEELVARSDAGAPVPMPKHTAEFGAYTPPKPLAPVPTPAERAPVAPDASMFDVPLADVPAWARTATANAAPAAAVPPGRTTLVPNTVPAVSPAAAPVKTTLVPNAVPALGAARAQPPGRTLRPNATPAVSAAEIPNLTPPIPETLTPVHMVSSAALLAPVAVVETPPRAAPAPARPTAIVLDEADLTPGEPLVDDEEVTETVEIDFEPEPEDLAPPADTVTQLLVRAKDLLDLDDHSGARALLERVLEQDPGNAKGKELLARCEITLVTMFESKLGDLGYRPRQKLRPDEIVWLKLDHREGFLLSLIDGQVSYDDVFALSAMTRLETARILAKLLGDSIIG